jgi:transaldolase
MTKLQQLLAEHGQSPWLDNLRRGWITDGELQRWVDRGVRGITSNPTIFQKAMSTGTDYDAQFGELLAKGTTVEQSYWDLVTKDIYDALGILRPVYDASDGLDGYVSVEVDPRLARDTEGTKVAARHLWDVIDRPNLYVKIPATREGVPAISDMIAEGRNINVTLIFSLERYDEVIEAYLSGLEHAVGSAEALELRGKAAVANAKLAYQLFLERFSGPRWDALVARGARYQRPLWASTSTKSPALPDTLYVDELIGPDTVNTLPEATIDAFEDHGKIARTIDRHLDEARRVFTALAAVGVDITDVTRVLEEEGVAAFSKSFDELIGTLTERSHSLR